MLSFIKYQKSKFLYCLLLLWATANCAQASLSGTGIEPGWASYKATTLSPVCCISRFFCLFLELTCQCSGTTPYSLYSNSIYGEHHKVSEPTFKICTQSIVPCLVQKSWLLMRNVPNWSLHKPKGTSSNYMQAEDSNCYENSHSQFHCFFLNAFLCTSR